jgi:DNA-binding transcriptional LysR family regulator
MSVPLVKLPSLDLLKGFVAIGRRMSVTRAADDLCLTQSAMSKQIKALEDVLGVRLLVRGHRSIAFTEEGQRLFQSANSAVQQVQDAIGALGTQRSARPVTITASIGVTALWLMPRLTRLQALHPGIDVRVAASNAVFDLAAEGIDLAIRYCREADAPASAELLFNETLAPVANPALRVRRWGTAEGLAEQVLLEYDDRRPWLQWSHWLRGVGLGDAAPRGMLRYNQYDLVIQAALAGQGVALGRLELLAPMLREGKLVQLDAPAAAAASRLGYWLVPAESRPRRNVAVVADFLREEARESLAAGVVPRGAF